MDWHKGLEAILRRNAPLAERTTFRIGGPAEILLEPATDREFVTAYAAAIRSGLPTYVLGGGSNLLIRDEGVRGIVISTSRLLEEAPVVEGDHVVVHAGMKLGRMVGWAAQRGLTGLECLTGIPGTIGGAVRMNAGGKYGYIGGRVAGVWCVNRSGGIVQRQGRDVRWGYRSTDLHDPVLVVEFRLVKDSPLAVKRRVRDILSEKRASQPMAMHSAGCFFKNPRHDSAGRLIDQAGLKGVRVGDACVSTQHANFIVNLGSATAADVLALAREIRGRVRARFGIVLEPEVCCWPTVA